MIIKDKKIDGGKVSSEYVRYRYIYQKILDLGLCKDGQRVLELGTGTGILREICILTEQNRLVEIFRKNKFSKHKSYLQKWILTILWKQQKT